jgi:hypothetical protein
VATRNTSASWLWVTIYEGDNYYTSGCVKPEGEQTWSLRMRPAAYRIRGETTRNAECKQPVGCDTSIRREPGMTRLEFASAGSACSWRPARDAGPLKTPGVAVHYEIYNATAASMWITIYEWGVFRDTIIRTHCLKPGKRHIWAFDQSTRYRAEMTRGTNCQQPVVCDTGKKALVENTNHVIWDLKANSATCWWQASGRPSNWQQQID